MDTMKHVINLSNIVDKLCKLMWVGLIKFVTDMLTSFFILMLFHVCRYQCIENDLLYPLQRAHNIAPYKSKGLEWASELLLGLWWKFEKHENQ